MSQCTKASSIGATRSCQFRSQCRCGLEAPLMTSWTDSNLGRRFFGCGMYKVHGHKRCSHFVWYDDELSSRAKEIIYSLQKKLEHERDRLDEANTKVADVKMKLNAMNLLMKFSVSMTLVMAVGLVMLNVMK
ncbi:uncharacterized protein LOC131628997 [Vicia villosa]|uniref:uncharacterized protein LOC131628997 n=1 Tax=Vicia villosa TaxID=3911 RepID=UPI00273BA9DD|nr:uncharacterized protein LOC131628997 [Vicia villosa]